MFLSFKIQGIDTVLKFMSVVLETFDVFNKKKKKLQDRIESQFYNTSMSLLLCIMLQTAFLLLQKGL